jgi:Tol biopolymer transport system component
MSSAFRHGAKLAVLVVVILLTSCSKESRVGFGPEPIFPSASLQLTKPSWSPDGKTIAYVQENFLSPDSAYQIWTLDVLTRRSTYLTLGTDPSWSPDSKSLAFIWGGLTIRDMATGTDRLVTDLASGSPTWLPNGTALAFQSHLEKPDNSGIRITDLTGTQIRLVLGFNNDQPSWSNVDSLLAVETWFLENGSYSSSEIAVYNVNSKQYRRLTVSARTDMRPAWSRDGARIAWVSQASGHKPTIWIMNADGSGQRDLGIEGDWPAWSSDGTILVYSTYDAASKTIALWQVDLTSGARTRLTTPPGAP